MTTQVSRPNSMTAAMGWMIGLSLLLAWIPVVGGLVAGFVGGRKAGGFVPAVAAALLPGFLLFLLSFVLGGLFGWIPLLGHLIRVISGMGGYVLSFVSVVPLLIGAAVGGATAR